MEGNVFPSSAVAGLMKPNFVEARLHTDSQNTLSDEQFATNQRYRDELAGTFAMPYFVVVDPGTGETVGEHGLSGGPGEWEPNWLDFLNFALNEAGRK